jgi:DMSO/TMAO reductase YedYZ heme-binding membrane subunit
VSGPSTYWYLTRGTGAVALLLLTAGLVLGIMGPTGFQTTRLRRFVVSGLHRNVTLLGAAFVVVHVVTTVLDGYAPIGLRDAVVPFVSRYRPLWLGLGAVAFDLVLALIVTSLLRHRIGLRTWRAVHWLAYVSWPVALLHSLGTGSDARSAWLVLLVVASTVAVAAAVVWRAVAARGAFAARVAAGAAAVTLPLVALAWYENGPARAGWASRAGTPTSLLASARTSATTSAAAATAFPSTFSAPLDGRFAEAGPDANGVLAVAITALTHGGIEGEVHLDIWGQPLEDGGVAMTASRVRFGPPGAPSQYAGRIAALDGRRVVASLRDASGRPLTLTLDLRIDPRSGTVGGDVRGVASET